MKRLISVLTVIAGLGIADTYVLPTRLDLGVFDPTYSLQQDTWTSSTTWLTGQLNGSSMTDFSPEREDAGIQSPCLTFDGVGDFVDTGELCNSIHQTGIFDLGFLMYVATTDNQRIAGNNILSSGYGFLADVLSGKVRFIIADGAGGGNYTVIHDGAPISVGWNKVRMWSTDGVTGYVQVDDNAPVATAYNRTPSVTNNANSTFRIGRVGTEASYFAGSIAYFKINDTFHYPLTEGSGSTVYDVSGNGNHGTITTTSGLTEMWSGTQTNSPYYAEYGGVEWTNATTTVYVPHLSDKVTPATNSVASYGIAQTNSAGLAHNAGGYSLIFGGATNTYTELLLYFDIRTNAAGLIESIYDLFY